jgi:hypothetical protein
MILITNPWCRPVRRGRAAGIDTMIGCCGALELSLRLVPWVDTPNDSAPLAIRIWIPRNAITRSINIRTFIINKNLSLATSYFVAPWQLSKIPIQPSLAGGVSIVASIRKGTALGSGRRPHFQARRLDVWTWICEVGTRIGACIVEAKSLEALDTLLSWRCSSQIF